MEIDVVAKVTIGSSTSWTMASCRKGHATSVRSDDLLDKMLNENWTLEQMQAAANERAEAQCEECHPHE